MKIFPCIDSLVHIKSIQMEINRRTFHFAVFAFLVLMIRMDVTLLIPRSQRISGDSRGLFYSMVHWRREDAERPYVDTPERRMALRQQSKDESDCTYVTVAPSGSIKLRVLYAQHGSGGTWLRYLIEMATGYYTGSHYRDNDDYMAGFKGESLDPFDRSVVVIRSVRPNVTREFQEKTSNRTVPEEAIVLIRNPYHSILSSFYRTQYLENGTIDDRKFSTQEWVDFANVSARAWFLGPFVTCKDIEPSLTVFYEDLLNDTETQLRRVTTFLEVELSDARMKCTLSNAKKVFKNYQRSGDLGMEPYTIQQKEIINTRIRALRKQLELRGCGVVPEYEVPMPVLKSENSTS